MIKINTGTMATETKTSPTPKGPVGFASTLRDLEMQLSLDPAFDRVEGWKLRDALKMLDQHFARMKSGVSPSSDPFSYVPLPILPLLDTFQTPSQRSVSLQITETRPDVVAAIRKRHFGEEYDEFSLPGGAPPGEKEGMYYSYMLDAEPEAKVSRSYSATGPAVSRATGNRKKGGKARRVKFI
jgi:hypothetical protein